MIINIAEKIFVNIIPGNVPKADVIINVKAEDIAINIGIIEISNLIKLTYTAEYINVNVIVLLIRLNGFCKPIVAPK